MDGLAVKPLTVDFHEGGFLAKLNQESKLGFWSLLSDDQKKQAGSPWGPSNPQALNRYSYVQNNPLGYTDPTGHDRIRLDGTTKDKLGHTQLSRYIKGQQDRVNEFWAVSGIGSLAAAFANPGVGILGGAATIGVVVEGNRFVGMLQNSQDFLNENGGGYVDVTIDRYGNVSVEAYAENGEFYGQYYEVNQWTTKNFLERYMSDYKEDKLPVDRRAPPKD